MLVRPDIGENEKPHFDIDRGLSQLRLIPSRNLTWKLDIKATVSPFLFLAVDLPPPPLFQDTLEKNIIPQVSIYSVLAKYDGRATQVGPIRRTVPVLTGPLGISWSASSIQVSAASSVPYPSFQAIHQEFLCRGKEPDNYKFSFTRPRLAGVYVIEIILKTHVYDPGRR